MYQLDILAQHRNALLLAEVAGWVHDYRKCSDEHLKTQAANLTNQHALPRNQIVQRFPNLQTISIPILGVSRTFAGLLDNRTWSNDVLGQFLSRCHNTAHFDKQEPVDGKQNYPGIKISTPFGFENDVPSPSLTAQLWGLPWNSVSNCTANRSGLSQAISTLFSQTVADTRRPTNEVDLWSWGLLVGALYKAALAGALLKGVTPAAQNLRWRLLAVQVNGLDYLIDVIRVPDLLARRQLLTDALNRVREMLEVTYPLGCEVYHDENGSIYVVPDVQDLLNTINPHNQSLETVIRETFASGIEGEIVPSIDLETNAWWGQDPNWPASPHDELPDIGEFLSRSVFSMPDIQRIQQFWSSNQNDICTVCGLRPQGPGPKAKELNLCDVCEQRRADRARDWRTQWLSTTIWLDEVADDNGRFALIVGSFDLTHWLSGACVRSLLVREPNQQNGYHADKIAKNPSFARLRRIWETTRAFWQEVGPTDNMQRLQDSVIGQHAGTAQPRLEITGQVQPAAPGARLEPDHAYELVLSDSVSLSALWDGQRFITCDNLPYLSRRMRSDIQQFLRSGLKMRVEVPGGYGATRTNWGTITINSTSVSSSAFVRAIPLLAEPRVFLALVPADQALDVVGAIKTKYEREMGKVRNRLPLHLGVVFALWHTPLRAVLDAGRQMLRQHAIARGWEVVGCARKTVSKGDPLPPRFAPDQQGQFAEWFEVTLERADHRVTWHVPALMGDGQTEDLWYPYVFLDATAEPVDRTRRFKAHNPWTGQDGWLIHAAELQPGDRVFFTPSTFDFEFLDTTARRFDVHYDDQGRRSRPTRPFYLDDLERMEALWGVMKRLSRTQRHQVVRTIEETRELWFGADHEWRSPSDPAFRQFAADTLAGAGWPKDQPWKTLPDQQRERLIDAAARGELADWFELHEQILKEEK